MKNIKNERGMVMVALLMGTLLLGALGMSMVSTVSTQTSHFDTGMQSSQAIYTAEGGMQYILKNQIMGDANLADNVSPTGAVFSNDSIKLPNGEFWAEYLNRTQNSMTVRVTGRVGDAIRVVEQDVTLTGGGSNNPASGAIVGGNVIMNSTFGDIHGDVVTSGNMNANAALKCQDAVVSQGGGDDHGEDDHEGDCEDDDHHDANYTCSNDDHDDDHDGDHHDGDDDHGDSNDYSACASDGHVDKLVCHDHIYEREDGEQPELDHESYKTLTTTTKTGNWTLKSDYTGNTCVKGDLRITKPITITGVLYVEGDVSFESSNIKVNGTIISTKKITAEHVSGVKVNSQPCNGKKMPGLVATGNIDLKDTDGLEVNGGIINKGNIDLTNTDNLKMTGCLMTKGNLILNSANNANITLDATLPSQLYGYKAPTVNSPSQLALSGYRTD